MIWLVALLAPALLVAADTEPAVQLKPHASPLRAGECQNCHFDKKSSFTAKKQKTQLQHAEIISQHGSKILACAFCHDRDNHNFLLSSHENPADFSNPSPVCQRCHAERFKDWKLGIHGKRTGGWKGDTREQLHCIECHNPHAVKFKSMQAQPAPHRPKLGIKKTPED